MKAQDYLGRIRWNRLKIEQKKNQIEKLKSAAGEIGINMDAPKVQSSHKSDIADIVARYEDLRAEIAEDVLSSQRELDEIVTVIQSVSKTLYADILYKKWIEDRTLEQIAVDMNYNFYYVKNSYMEALREVEKLIEKR